MRTLRDLKPRLVAIGCGFGISVLLTGCTGFGTPSPVTDADAREIQVTAEESAAVAREAQARDDARSQDWSRLTKEGRVHMMVGNLSFAEQSFMSAYQISKRFRDTDVRRRVSFGSLERLANKYLSENNTGSAAKVLQFIADETRGLSEVQYPDLGDLLVSLGDIYSGEGAHSKAEEAYRRALELRIDRKGINSTALIEIYRKLSGGALALERGEEALDFSEKRLRLAQLHMSETDPEVLDARLQIGAAYLLVERYFEAENAYLLALEGFQRAAPESLGAAIVKNALAFLYLKTQRLDEAIVYVDQALVILERDEIIGVTKASILDTKAQILAAQGKVEAADSTFASVMSESHAAPDRQRLAFYESFESFLIDQNRNAEAVEIRSRIQRITNKDRQSNAESNQTLGAPDVPEGGADSFTPPSGDASALAPAGPVGSPGPVSAGSDSPVIDAQWDEPGV